MSINPGRIHYVKNISRKVTPHSLSYCQYQLGAIFQLEFPNNVAQPGNAKKLTTNDIILLFQKEKNNNLKPVGNWLLTHLVQPISDNKVYINKKSRHPFYIKVKIVGKIPYGVDITITSLKQYLKLSETSSGNACKLKTAIKNSANISSVQQEIVKVFNQYGSVL